MNETRVMLLTPRQVAERLHVATSTLAKIRCRGGGPAFVKFGSRVLYPAHEVERWIAAQPLRRSTAETAAHVAD